MHPASPPTPRPTPLSLIAAAALFCFAVLTNLATVLNNAYSFGATFHDSTFFQTVIWRSGLLLKLPSSFGGVSFLHTHLSPINLVPNALSYLLPVDRMTYYGLVYGVVDGLLLVAVFIILRALFAGRVIPAFVGTALFYCSGPIVYGQFEPHQEYASSLFMVAFFIAWAFGRRRWAWAMLLLNASVREDCGALLALPLGLLTLHAAWRDPRSPAVRQLAWFTIASALLTVAAFVVRARYFSQFDTLSAFYYPPWPRTFDHLSADVVVARVHAVLRESQFIFVPGIISCVAALLLRDIRLSFAFVAYLPYWVFNFFSALELNAVLGSYKSFPFLLMLVWPAILGAGAARRRGLVALQVLVLLAASFGWQQGGVRFMSPLGFEDVKRRWLLQPETQHAEIYRMLEPRMNADALGLLRASAGVLALYPYNFESWRASQVLVGREDGAPYLQSLIWFQGDRDQATTDRYLEQGRFPWRYSVIGTKLRIASRKPPSALPGFIGLIETTQHP